MRWLPRSEMPTLAASARVWVGEYIHVDLEAQITDRHASQLIVRLFDDGDIPYHQSNLYTWPDGRTERNDFQGAYVNGSREIVFDSPRINGFVKELAEDPFGPLAFCIGGVRSCPTFISTS